jgi:plasmid rolling circle replication initiator protein Rep
MTDKEKPLHDEALAGISQNKGSETSLLPSRLERYSKSKSRQLKIVNYLRDIANGKIDFKKEYPLDFKKYSSLVGSCGNYLVFNNYYTVDKVRLAKASFCKTHLLCPLCAIRRGSKQVQGYLSKFNEIVSKNPHLEAHFLTLTVKNGFDFEERLLHLQKSIKSLLKSRRNYETRSNGFNEFCKIKGAVYSYEFSYSEKHGWHPHIHMVIFTDKNNPIDFDVRNPKNSQLSKDWLSLTGDSFIVDCRLLKGEPSEAFCEVFKYALKYSSMSIGNNITAFMHLKGRRLQGSFGVFRGVKIPNELTDELLDDLPYIELFYKYSKTGYSLSRTTHKQT